MYPSPTSEPPEKIAIDFDGVIHDHKNPIEGRRMGLPMEGAKEAITKLRHKYKIVVFSVWGHSKAVEDWLKYYKIPFDECTNIKPQAKYYIDDKAIRHINWAQTLKEVV